MNFGCEKKKTKPGECFVKSFPPMMIIATARVRCRHTHTHINSIGLCHSGSWLIIHCFGCNARGEFHRTAIIKNSLCKFFFWMNVRQFERNSLPFPLPPQQRHFICILLCRFSFVFVSSFVSFWAVIVAEVRFCCTVGCKRPTPYVYEQGDSVDRSAHDRASEKKWKRNKRYTNRSS